MYLRSAERSGIMDRFSFRISENNRRRLDILKAFSVLDGKNPTLQDLVNESIELFFVDITWKWIAGAIRI